MKTLSRWNVATFTLTSAGAKNAVLDQDGRPRATISTSVDADRPFEPTTRSRNCPPPMEMRTPRFTCGELGPLEASSSQPWSEPTRTDEEPMTSKGSRLALVGVYGTESAMVTHPPSLVTAETICDEVYGPATTFGIAGTAGDASMLEGTWKTATGQHVAKVSSVNL